MAKLNNTIKLQDAVKKGLIKDTEKTFKEINVLNEKLETTKDVVNKLDVALNKLEIEYNEFLSGAVPMDAVRLLEIRHQKAKLNDEKNMHLNNMQTLQSEFEEMETVLIDVLFNKYKDDLLQEYAENRYVLINKMFCKFMEIVELSEQLTEESNACKNALRETEHEKAYNYQFETGTSMVFNRFVMNGFGIKYSQSLTTDVLEFEEEYFNSKK